MVQIGSLDKLQKFLLDKNYIADCSLKKVIFLAHKFQLLLLLEGEAGVGKTEVGKVLAEIFNTELSRLQCYEGLDLHQTVYEWNYTRQM